jgi:hypothetical protein
VYDISVNIEGKLWKYSITLTDSNGGIGVELMPLFIWVLVMEFSVGN